MPPIAHSFALAIAPLSALLIALALPLATRSKGWLAASAPLALFAGWALLQGAALPHALWAAHRGLETLLAPDVACLAGVALAAWRGQTRLASVLTAVFAGWWVARAGVSPADFWRVWFAVAALAAVVSRVTRGRADRLLVLAAALCGGLAVAGAAPGWTLAALVCVAAAAGLVAADAASQAGAANAAIATFLGAAELAGGSLLRFRIDLTDVACLAALVAPFISDACIGRLPRRFAPVLSRGIGAAGAIGVVWMARRAFFT